MSGQALVFGLTYFTSTVGTGQYHLTTQDFRWQERHSMTSDVDNDIVIYVFVISIKFLIVWPYSEQKMKNDKEFFFKKVKKGKDSPIPLP